MGQSTYTEELADRIIAGLEAGLPLRQICQPDDMPAHSTVILWTHDIPAFADRYARARSIGLDAMAEQIIEIADVCRPGEKIERKEISRSCSLCTLEVRWQRNGWRHDDKSDLCEGAEAIPQYETKTVTGDMVDRARLQVDARKWLLSKMRPDKYGDRTALEHTGPGGAPLVVTVEFVKPKEEPE